MIFAIVFILAGFIGMLHQKLFTSGGWFSFEQMFHHEWFITIAFALGVGVLIGIKISTRKRR